MEEIDKDGYIEALNEENKLLRGKNTQQAIDISSSSATQKNENLIQYQIENTDLLDELEHFYRGEYIGTLENGEVGWVLPEDETQIPMNKFGVSSMMEIVSKYIDKNTTLSYYSELRIYEVMADLGDELILFVLCNYEKMGMNDKVRKTKYRLLIVTTLHMIESTYRKAISGKTVEEINQSRIISQSDTLGRSPYQMPHKQKFSLLNPISWH